MKALLILWNLSAAHTGQVAVIPFDSLAACYAAADAEQKPAGTSYTCLTPAQWDASSLAREGCTLIAGESYVYECRGRK